MITYDKFKILNDKNKIANTYRIEKVTDDNTLLTNGKTVSVTNLISAVLNGNLYIENPSKLSEYKYFNKYNISYEEFKKKNDYLKDTNKIISIENNVVILGNNKKVSLKELVEKIEKGQFYISNPSILSDNIIFKDNGDEGEKEIETSIYTIKELEEKGFFGGFKTKKENSDIVIDIFESDSNKLKNLKEGISNVSLYDELHSKDIEKRLLDNDIWVNKLYKNLQNKLNSNEENEVGQQFINDFSIRSESDLLNFYKNTMKYYDKYTVATIKRENDTNFSNMFALRYKYYEGKNYTILVSYSSDIFSNFNWVNDNFSAIIYLIPSKEIIKDKLTTNLLPSTYCYKGIYNSLLTEVEIVNKEIIAHTKMMQDTVRYCKYYLIDQVNYENLKSVLKRVFNESYVNEEKILSARKSGYSDYYKRTISLFYFLYSFLTNAEDNSDFLKLHKVKNIQYFTPPEERAYFTLRIDLYDSNSILIGCYSDIKIKYLYKEEEKKVIVVDFKDKDLKDWVAFSDSVWKEKSKLISDNFKNLHLSEELESIMLYKKLDGYIKKFFTPRKLNIEDFKYLFSSIICSYEKVVIDYGLQFKKEGNYNQDGTSWVCAINGDNDDYLKLIWNLDVSKDHMGIRVRGKSNNKTLDYTENIIDRNEDNTDKVSKDTHLFVTELFLKVCDVLGVSKFRCYCTKNGKGFKMLYGTYLRLKDNELNKRVKSETKNSIIVDIGSFVECLIKIHCTPSELFVTTAKPNVKTYNLTDKVQLKDIWRETENLNPIMLQIKQEHLVNSVKEGSKCGFFDYNFMKYHGSIVTIVKQLTEEEQKQEGKENDILFKVKMFDNTEHIVSISTLTLQEI